MAGRRFTSQEIDAALEAWQAGVSIADVCRRHGVSEATLYRWRSTRCDAPPPPAGPAASEARELRRVRSELVVTAAACDALRLVVGELLDPQQRERAARLIEAHFRMSARRARSVVGLPPRKAGT